MSISGMGCEAKGLTLLVAGALKGPDRRTLWEAPVFLFASHYELSPVGTVYQMHTQKGRAY